MRLFFITLALVLSVTAGQAQTAAAAAQTTQAAPPKKVGKVSIKFIGIANISEQIVRANIEVRPGDDYDEGMIDRDIRSLYRTGLFEFIEVKREELPNNTVNLLYELTPKYRVLAVRFEGNRKMSTSRLRKVVTIRPNSALDERIVKDDAEKLREFYQKEGYNQIQVSYDIHRDRSSGFGTIIYKIREGNKVRIQNIRFVGNAHVSARTLRKQMQTRRWWIFSWLTGSGKFKDEQFEDDIEKLIDYYRDHGYLDVEIPRDEIQYDYPKPDRMVITIHIHEGRQYRIGEISIVGAKIYDPSMLRLVLREHSGMIYRPKKLEKDVEDLEDFYGRAGYLDTNVTMERQPNLRTGNIDIVYHIDEGQKFYVESIKIEGNTKTKNIVILRELLLGPGDVFDKVRMKASELRLENTRFFENPVNVSAESTNIPGRRNLKVSVREARTGNLSFGAGYSSLERATFFAEISQSNFDLFNRRNFFQGAGEKFRLRFQIGSLSNEVVLDFEQPWVFEKEITMGFSIYRQSSSYVSSYYTEIRQGAQVYARKHLFGFVNGQLALTDEQIEIGNVDPSASPIIRSLAGKTRTVKLQFQLLRDVRDKIVNTTRGSRMELDLGFAGGPLGGSNDYYSMEFRGSEYIPVFRPQTQVLALIGRVGVIQDYGKSSTVPFYDKYFLGGQYDLRGFQYDDVGPKDSLGEPLGGKTYAMFSAEYSFDVVSPVRFVIFYDAGFLNGPAYDFNPANYNDDFGFGLRLFVAGAPVELDFGIPLTTDKFNNKGNQFNFNFGARY